jgi:allantoinase
MLNPVPERVGPVPYRAYPDAPVIRWPNGARIAVWIVPNLEWYPLDKVIGPNKLPDIKSWAIREYGERVGVWRIMEALDSVGARATVALNAYVCDIYPRVIEAGRERGWEWMGHGLTNSDSKIGQTEEEERAQISQTIDRIHEATGVRPRGWLGPDENHRTPSLLQDAGLTYSGDWVVDDRPYPIKTDNGWMLGVPYSMIHNDSRNYERWIFSPNEYCEQLCRAFDVLYAEGERSGTVMAIPLHTHLSGFPARSVALKQLLQYIHQHNDVWWATGSEIADSYLAQVGLPQE